MMNVLDAMFGHPRGLMGRVGGVIMARRSGLRNEWTLSLLDIGRDDRVLEVGCGPGALIQALSARAMGGFVAGVDPSPIMLRQAVRRNAQAIRKGRVQLQFGSCPQDLPIDESILAYYKFAL